MGINYKKQLNKAEKIVLCAAVAALIVTSARPQVAVAANVSVPTIDSTPALKQAAEPPSLPVVPPVTVKRTVIVVATAYSSTPDQTDDTPFITSNGKQVYDGLVAANWLPYGTKVRLPDMFGDKIFTVNDRMNRRFSDRMDVWFKTRDDAKKFGIRHIRIQIVQ